MKKLERKARPCEPKLLAVPAVYFFFYMAAFLYLERTVVPRYWIASRFDAYIPFCSAFLIPYVLWFLLIPAAFLYFYRTDREEYIKLCKLVLTGLTVCLALYALFPNGQKLRAAITGDGVLDQLVRLLRRADTSTNVCPSIHVFVSVSVGTMFQNTPSLRDKPGVRWSLSALVLLICLSTVFLKQHSVIDVACGAALSALLSAAFGCSRLGQRLAQYPKLRKNVAYES